MLFFISYLDPSRMHHLYKVEYEGEGGGGVCLGGVLGLHLSALKIHNIILKK